MQGKVNFKYDRLKCRFYEIEYEPSPEEAITGYNPLEVGSSALRPNTSFTSQYRDITESNRKLKSRFLNGYIIFKNNDNDTIRKPSFYQTDVTFCAYLRLQQPGNIKLSLSMTMKTT